MLLLTFLQSMLLLKTTWKSSTAKFPEDEQGNRISASKSL